MYNEALTRLLADAYIDEVRRAAMPVTPPTREHGARRAPVNSIRALVARFAH
jgi:hypothetical protein